MPADIFSKIIIADTSCLIAFASIGRFDILHSQCRTVIITVEVASEFHEPLPGWIQTAVVKDSTRTKTLNTFLGLGEASAIALALETENALVILDDKKARRYAHSIGLDIIGILGLLNQAHRTGIIEDISEILSKLRAIGFYLPPNADQLIQKD